MRLYLEKPIVKNSYAEFYLNQVSGKDWSRCRVSVSTGKLSADGKILIFPGTIDTGDFILNIRHPENEIQITSLRYGKHRYGVGEFQLKTSTNDSSCRTESNIWVLTKKNANVQVEILRKRMPDGYKAADWNRTALAGILALFAACVSVWIFHQWSLKLKKVGNILCFFLFRTRYALFAASCVAGMAVLVWLLFCHSPTAIKVEFADAQPQTTLIVKTAVDTWFCEKTGLWGKAYSFNSQTENGISKAATSFPIGWFWLIPQSGNCCIRSVSIGGTEISAEDLYQMALEQAPENRLTEKGLELKQLLAFECRGILWNSQVKMQWVKTVIGLVFLWLLSFTLFAAITVAVQKQMFRVDRINVAIVIGIVSILGTISILTYLYVSRFVQCETHIFDNDSDCNINVVIYWLLGKPYRMDPFITTGPGLLVPIAGLLWVWNSLEWFAIGVSVLTVNFFYALLPLWAVCFFTPYSWEKKGLWSLAYCGVLLLGTSLFSFDFISSPLGELPAVCVFIAAILMMFYCRSWGLLIVAGFLAGVSCEIKTVMGIFIVAIVTIWIWLFCSARSRRERIGIFRMILFGGIGYGIAKIAGIGFRILVLGNIMTYQSFLADSSKQNLESGLNLNNWSADFIRETIGKNFDLLIRQIGQPCIILLLIMTLFSIYTLLSKKSPRYNIVPACLIFTAFFYGVFWLLTQSHNWNIRNFEPGWMVFTLSSTLFLLDEEKRFSTRTWLAILFPLVFIFGIFDSQRYLTVRPTKEITLYVKLNKVLHQEKENGAYPFVSGLPPYLFYEFNRGNRLWMPFYHDINSLFKTIPQKYSSVVWCRPKQSKLPPGYKGYFSTVLFDDGNYVISKQERPQ